MDKNTEDAVNSILSFLKDLRLNNGEGSEDIEWHKTDWEGSSDLSLEGQENDSEDSSDSLERQEKDEITFKDIYLELGSEEVSVPQENDGGGGSDDSSLGSQESDDGSLYNIESLESDEDNSADLDLMQRDRGIHDELLIKYRSFTGGGSETDQKLRYKYNTQNIIREVKLSLLKFFLSHPAPNHLLICYFMNKDIFMNTYFTISISHNREITQRFKETVDLKHLKELNISKILGMCDKIVLGYRDLLYKAPLKETPRNYNKGKWMLIKEIKYYSMSYVTKEYYFRNSEINKLYCLGYSKDEGTMTNSKCKGFKETTDQNMDPQQQQIGNKDTGANDLDNNRSNPKNDELDDDFEDLIRCSAEMNLEPLSVESFQDVSDQTQDEDNVEDPEEIIDKLISDLTQDVGTVEEEDPEEIIDETGEIQVVDPVIKECLDEIIEQLLSAEEKKKKQDEAHISFQKFFDEILNEIIDKEKECRKSKIRKDPKEMIRIWDETLKRETRQLVRKREEREFSKREEEREFSKREEREFSKREEEREFSKREEREFSKREEEREFSKREEEREFLKRKVEREFLKRKEEREFLERKEEREFLERKEEREILERKEEREILERKDEREFFKRNGEREFLKRNGEREFLKRKEESSSFQVSKKFCQQQNC